MDVGVRLLRNGTAINTRSTVAYHLIESSITFSFAYCYVDSGASTGSTTYTIQGKSNRGTCNASFAERAMVIHYALQIKEAHGLCIIPENGEIYGTYANTHENMLDDLTFRAYIEAPLRGY